MSGDLGDFLAEGGAIVGGGAALGATLGFIAGSLLHDIRPTTKEASTEAFWDRWLWRFAA